MNRESWLANLDASLLDMVLWKRQYIAKQREKNPLITKKELSKKIKNARRSKFKGKYDFLIFEHPDRPYLD